MWRRSCLDRVEVIEDRALLEPLLLPEPWATTNWATSSDLGVFHPTGTTDAEREAVRARLEAVDGVARVTYESPAEAYRRLPRWERQQAADPATPIRGTRRRRCRAPSVALDDPARAGRSTWPCAATARPARTAAWSVWEHPPP